MPIDQSRFIVAGNSAIDLFTLRNGDFSVGLCPAGASIVSFTGPGRKGPVDIALAYEDPREYLVNPVFFGCVAGRFANRIGKARFSIGGTTYRLEANDGPNCLHSGSAGYHARVFRAEASDIHGRPAIRFCLEDEAGRGGFPGALSVRVTYTLDADGSLGIHFEASADAATPVNLTNHCYFNLAGSGDVLGHELRIHASRYLEVGPDVMPTGKLLDAQGGPFDFKDFKPIGRDIEKVVPGYDNCYVLDGPVDGEGLRLAAEARCASSGVGLEVRTSQPGVQFYSAHYLKGVKGRGGAVYGKFGGFCLETQHYPDSPNQPGFPDCVLLPGKRYSERCVYRFIAAS
jgi:aldose 1-epimerase